MLSLCDATQQMVFESEMKSSSIILKTQVSQIIPSMRKRVQRKFFESF